MFYYVIKHETMIIRAAQSTIREALKYSTPERFIAGPMTAETLHRLFPETRKTGTRNLAADTSRDRVAT